MRCDCGDVATRARFVTYGRTSGPLQLPLPVYLVECDGGHRWYVRGWQAALLANWGAVRD